MPGDRHHAGVVQMPSPGDRAKPVAGHDDGVRANTYQFGQIYPVPAGDLKQPTDSGITCFGSHSTTLGK